MENTELSREKILEKINAAPDVCPITGLEKCDSYIIDGNVVYLTNPAYDAYTLPEYDNEEKAFYRIHYDMDDDNREENEFLCDFDDLRDRKDFEEIKKFFNIQE